MAEKRTKEEGEEAITFSDIDYILKVNQKAIQIYVEVAKQYEGMSETLSNVHDNVNALTTRGQIAGPTDTIQLVASFRDGYGAFVDCDSIPSVTLTSPTGLVTLGPTTAGVMHLDTGRYQFDFTIGLAGSLGVWQDSWVGFINGHRADTSYSFIVDTTQLPALNTDGYVSIGQDPGFHYSQVAILNINKLLKSLRARLNSRGKAKSKDPYGNSVYVDCDIYSTSTLVTFLATSLSRFNQIPYFTFFTFEDTKVIDQFLDILVEGAALDCLASQALIERGLEFNVSDNGISFTPPSMSELLNTQYSTMLTSYREDLKFIKNNMRSAPMGLGSFAIGMNPQIAKLRHRRANQLI